MFSFSFFLCSFSVFVSGCYECMIIKQFRTSIQFIIHSFPGWTNTKANEMRRGSRNENRQKKEQTKRRRRISWGITIQKPGVRWSVRRSSGVRSCLLCRLPGDTFRVNWPTHGNSFSLSLLLFLCGLHTWDWLTRYTHSCLSSFLSLCLSSSLSLSANLVNTTPQTSVWTDCLFTSKG